MRFKIFFTTPKGDQTAEVSGATIKAIKSEANQLVKEAGGVEWSSKRLPPDDGERDV